VGEGRGAGGGPAGRAGPPYRRQHLQRGLARGADAPGGRQGEHPSPEWDFVSLMVRKDLVDSGQVRDYRDLKGLTIAMAGPAAAPEIEVAKALEKGGLTLADVNLTIVSFPDMIAAFPNKAID